MPFKTVVEVISESLQQDGCVLLSFGENFVKKM